MRFFERRLGIGLAAAFLSFQSTEDCDPIVQTRVQSMSLAAVDNATAMAQYGYTPMPTGGTSGLSCIDNLLGGGINIIFSVPTIDQLLAALISTTCNYAQGIIQQNMSYLSSQAQGSLQMGEFIPGVPMPNITGGFSVMGTQNGPITQPGGQQISNFNTYWGGNQSPSQADPYSGMFGGPYNGGGTGGGGTGLFNRWFGK
jgi:hypothetical protein